MALEDFTFSEQVHGQECKFMCNWIVSLILHRMYKWLFSGLLFRPEKLADPNNAFEIESSDSSVCYVNYWSFCGTLNSK